MPVAGYVEVIDGRPVLCPAALGGSVVVFAHLPSQVELEGPVLGARYVDVIDGCPVLCPAALGGPWW